MVSLLPLSRSKLSWLTTKRRRRAGLRHGRLISVIGNHDATMHPLQVRWLLTLPQSALERLA
jgi:hypothetical protein